MKRLVVLILTSAWWGCAGPSFPVELKGETTVQGQPLGGVLNAFPGIGSFTNLDFNATHEFKQQGVTKDQVSSLKITELRLKIINPSDQDFRFLDSLEFFARSADQETRIAERAGISELPLSPPNPVLNLQLTQAELREHLGSATMNIIVRGRGRQPAQDTRLEATATVQVEVRAF